MELEFLLEGEERPHVKIRLGDRRKDRHQKLQEMRRVARKRAARFLSKARFLRPASRTCTLPCQHEHQFIECVREGQQNKKRRATHVPKYVHRAASFNATHGEAFLTKPKLPYPLGPQHLIATPVATSDCMITQGPLCAASTDTVTLAPGGTSSTLCRSFISSSRPPRVI